MSRLFSPIAVNGLQLPNRFVRSATFDGLAEANGEVSPAQVSRYRDLAWGGVGLIVSCATSVSEKGRFYPNQNRLDRSEFVAGFARLARAVHEGGGKLAVQLFHGGREVSRRTGRQGLAPSPGPDPRNQGLRYRQISAKEIRQVVEDFGLAAARAREAGCDAVQIHAAHAFLFAQFLSPDSNQRQDQWGGALDNRMRLHLAVLSSLRERAGSDFPLLVKLGLRDGFEGGLSMAEGLEVAERLSAAGCDALEISQGLRGSQERETEFRTKLGRPQDQGYFRHWAGEVKQRVSTPVITVGGIRDLAMAEEIEDRGMADLVAMCRPLICEPALVGRWRQGDRKPARCISCNRCKRELASLRPIQCFLGSE